jgi:hypothetical protein
MLILDPCGMPFHAVPVFSLGMKYDNFIIIRFFNCYVWLKFSYMIFFRRSWNLPSLQHNAILLGIEPTNWHPITFFES